MEGTDSKGAKKIEIVVETSKEDNEDGGNGQDTESKQATRRRFATVSTCTAGENGQKALSSSSDSTIVRPPKFDLPNLFPSNPTRPNPSTRWSTSGPLSRNDVI